MTVVFVANKAPQSVSIGGQTAFGMSFAAYIKPVDGTESSVPVVAGYAITSNIEKQAWDEWTARNHDSHMLKIGMLLAHENLDNLKTMLHGAGNTKPRVISHNWAAARAK